MKEILTKLGLIQGELKAPKNQFNKFGGYKYRSCEDILEAVKPLAHKHGCTLTVGDTLENIGDRYYVTATATLYDNETAESISNTASAREEESKKGMDGSQITGTASSYARKYALNGLFCIDDTKDADTDEYKKQQENTKDKPIVQDSEVKCPQCGKVMAAMKAKDGNTVMPADFLKNFGKCMNCLKAEQKK
jgi:uncharacterized protein with PIN domain